MATISYPAVLLVACVMGGAAAAQQPAMPPIGAGFPEGKTIDLAGFFPGMDGAKARQAIPPHYVKQESKPDLFEEKVPFSNEPFLRYVRGNRYGNEYDNITLFFSGPRSGNQAIFIRREARFEGDNRPNRQATLAALKQKFGEPSQVILGGEVMQYFFANGKALTTADRQSVDACASGTTHLSNVGNYGGMGGNTGDQVIANIFGHYTPTKPDQRAPCDIIIFVRLNRGYDNVGGQRIANDNVLYKLDIFIFDVGRFNAARAIDARAIDALRDKARQSVPTGAPAPKL